MERNMPNLKIENARICFPNFEGRGEKFNPEGRRNFLVRLNVQDAERLQAEGWNVRIKPAREEGDDPFCTLQVAVNFDGYLPPRVYLISDDKKTLLDEDTINILDHAEFSNVDLVIRPYRWEVNGKTGIKAYLKTMYAVLEKDEFAQKYADCPSLSSEGEPLEDGDMPF